MCLEVGKAGARGADLFVGDTLFAGSIGRTDLPGGDTATLLASIRNVLFPFGDDARVYPGHGPATTIGQERRTNPFLSNPSAPRPLSRSHGRPTSGPLSPSNRQLDTSDPETVAAAQDGPLDAFVVDERAVGARQVDHFEAVFLRAQPAVQARHERDVEDEVGPGGASDGLDGARREAEREGGVSLEVCGKPCRIHMALHLSRELSALS